ncbi:UNVERIFIED_CONTAM: movement protein [Sesamum angustifolium]|uniref:Movement protein n=1 Tax=Sesamum angustifolium TaxID=2727405 RepID=A0AAW2NYM3_9LAMI
MDLQPSQNNYSEEDRLQTSESLSGFFSRMTISNKTMERIMRQDSNLSPYDGFRIGGIGKVLNQIGLNQRKHHIIYKVSSGEFAIPMEFTGNVMEMQLIPKEEILEELSRLREEVAVTMKWIHIGTMVVIKATFKEGIDSEIHLSIMDRRINNLRDGCLGTMIGNLYAGKLMFDIHPRIAYNLADQDFSRVLTLHQDFKRKDLMKEGNRPYSITYRIAYALSNTHHSDLFLRKEYIEIPRIFKEFAKQPVVGRYEGMLEIAGHEILVTGVAGRENGSMILGISFLEDHKPWGRKGNAKPGVFPKEARETLPVIAGRDFSQKILILNTGIREAKIMIGEHLEHPGLGEIQVLRREKAFNRIMPIKFRSKRGDVDAKLTHPKMQDKRKFGKVLLSFRQQGLIDSDSFYKESEEEIENLKEALVELKTMDISEESKLSLENVKRLIQRNFSENPLAWWDRNKIEATLKIKEECKYEYVRYKPIQMNMEDKKDMQMIIKEHINLGLIEPGISAYSSPGFLVRNHGEIKRGKPRYTGGLFTEQQAKVWHINEKEFFAVWKAFKKWPLFLLAKEFTLKVDNTNVKAFLKNKLESKIEKARIIRWQAECQYYCYNIVVIKSHENVLADFLTRDEASEANSIMLRLRHLRENLEELNREFGRLAVNAQVAGQVQRADLDLVQTNIRSSLVASTALWNALQEPIRKGIAFGDDSRVERAGL